MTDIVDKLALMPIAEWEEARVEILRLRGLLDATTEVPRKYPVSTTEDVQVTESPDHESKITELTTEILRLSGLMAESEAAVEAAQSQASLLEAQLAAQANVENPPSAYAIEVQEKLTQALSEAKDREAAMVAEFATFKTTYDAAIAEVIASRQKAGEDKIAFAALQAELDALQVAYTALKVTIPNMKQTIEKLTEDLEAQRDHNKFLVGEVATAKTPLVSKIAGFFNRNN